MSNTVDGKSLPSWRYDEFEQVGRDYSQSKEAEAYDTRHADFRDVDQENRAALDLLEAGAGHVLVDLGAGTGAFVVQAANHCAEVLAVDVSEAMLARARERAEAAGAANVSFHVGGFLTFERPDQSVDLITTSLALHHLPDLWKGVALKRMHAMLKPGGKLFIRDVILAQENALQNAQALIDTLAAVGGESLQRDMEVHLSDEFSTYDWIMDGLIERAGFAIKQKTMQEGVIGTYLCVKPLPAA